MKAIPIKAGLFTVDDLTASDIALRGMRCADCGGTFFPPRRICPCCRRAGTLIAVALNRIGTISAMTSVVRFPAHYAAPYVLAEVDLPEGVRLRAQIAGPEAGALRVGDAVELAVEPLFDAPDGSRVFGYRFRKAMRG